MRRTLVAVPLLLFATAQAKSVAPVKSASSAWSAAQAVGPPDAGAGDHPNAWAPLTADGGLEWLELRYARAVDVVRVTVHENEKPGCVRRVIAYSDDGREHVIWEGEAPAQPAPSRFDVTARKPIRSDRIRVELDTTRVAGWNEIDAVELTGADGSRQWAVAATASTSYADFGAGSAALTPFGGLIGRKVRVHVGADVLEGRLAQVDSAFLRLEDAYGKILVVSLAALAYLEATP